jgi:23S rRNA pseudouridine1911/1915/1917 synthase
MNKRSNYKPDTKFIIDNNTYLLEFLLSNIENKSKNNIKSLLSHGNIYVDGNVITKYNYELHKGQEITIKWSLIRDENNNNLDIIYEDNDIIVINKPAGLLSISTDKEKEITAYHIVSDYIKKHNHNGIIFIVHRLDKETSGVLLFAKNEKIKHLLQDNWNDIVIKRGYIAVAEGKVEKDSDTIKSWLKETKTKMMYSSHIKGDGQEAITHYRKIKSNNDYSLLDINIDTGRKNQIRVHMSDIGHSIAGDKKYYAITNPLKRLSLHASVLEFRHPFTNKIMHFEAKTPNEFISLFN